MKNYLLMQKVKNDSSSNFELLKSIYPQSLFSKLDELKINIENCKVKISEKFKEIIPDWQNSENSYLLKLIVKTALIDFSDKGYKLHRALI